jgi:hypothetical protein
MVGRESGDGGGRKSMGCSGQEAEERKKGGERRIRIGLE